MTGLEQTLVLVGLGIAMAIPGPDVAASPPPLPDAVSKTFKATFPQAKIIDVESEGEDGVTVYSIEFTDGNAEKSAGIAADGTLMETGNPIQAKDVPVAAMNAIKQAASGATVGRIERIDITHETENGKLIKLPATVSEYTGELKRKGKTGEVVVAADGTVVEPVSWKK